MHQFAERRRWTETKHAMRLRWISFLCILVACTAARASSLVSGNGFGFAVVSPTTASVTKFYAHPYSFVGPDPKDSLSEGIETANFIKKIGWSDETAGGASAEYEEDSHVIRARSSAGEGLFFMPFGLRQTALILSWKPTKTSGYLSVEWNRPVSSQRMLRAAGTDVPLLRFDGVEESLALIAIGPRWNARAPSEQLLAGNLTWALVAIPRNADAASVVRAFLQWRGGLAPEALAAREIAELERWRVTPTVHFANEKERHLWRQSEVMLRMAQSREPNHPGRYNNGMIVAALPDAAWFMTWVRDMAYASVALARMGHREEARAALLAYFNARPTGKMRAQTAGADYQISVVRYFGNGEEEPFFTNEGNTNIEFDDWGLALWVLGGYLDEYNDSALLREPTYRGRLYESARDYVVKPLLANMEPYGGGLIVRADTSVWEEHQKDKKHFAFSTAAAIVGLKEFAGIAQREGDGETHTRLLEKVALLEKGFHAAFIRDGRLRGTLEQEEKNDIDGALLPIIEWGIVTDPAVVHDAVQRMNLLKVSSGGYRRVRSNYTDPAIYEYWYERQEFVFVDLALAEVYRLLGKNADAAALLERTVNKSAADHNIIPEMYVSLPCKLFPGAIGDPTGALPMVGYGAGAYILDLLQRQSVERDHR